MANTTNNIEEQEVVSVSSDNAPAEDALSQEAEQTEAPKRRRGRPRKTEVENAEDNTEEKPKRRGRPRKADADLQAESETEQADVEEKPKRRGRPRKSEEVEIVEEKPKRRGRPRKVEVDQEMESTTEEMRSLSVVVAHARLPQSKLLHQKSNLQILLKMLRINFKMQLMGKFKISKMHKKIQ